MSSSKENNFLSRFQGKVALRQEDGSSSPVKAAEIVPPAITTNARSSIKQPQSQNSSNITATNPSGARKGPTNRRLQASNGTTRQKPSNEILANGMTSVVSQSSYMAPPSYMAPSFPPTNALNDDSSGSLPQGQIQEFGNFNDFNEEQFDSTHDHNGGINVNNWEDNEEAVEKGSSDYEIRDPYISQNHHIVTQSNQQPYNNRISKIPTVSTSKKNNRPGVGDLQRLLSEGIHSNNTPSPRRAQKQTHHPATSNAPLSNPSSKNNSSRIPSTYVGIAASKRGTATNPNDEIDAIKQRILENAKKANHDSPLNYRNNETAGDDDELSYLTASTAIGQGQASHVERGGGYSGGYSDYQPYAQPKKDTLDAHLSTHESQRVPSPKQRSMNLSSNFLQQQQQQQWGGGYQQPNAANTDYDAFQGEGADYNVVEDYDVDAPVVYSYAAQHQQRGDQQYGGEGEERGRTNEDEMMAGIDYDSDNEEYGDFRMDDMMSMNDEGFTPKIKSGGGRGGGYSSQLKAGQSLNHGEKDSLNSSTQKKQNNHGNNHRNMTQGKNHGTVKSKTSNHGNHVNLGPHPPAAYHRTAFGSGVERNLDGNSISNAQKAGPGGGASGKQFGGGGGGGGGGGNSHLSKINSHHNQTYTNISSKISPLKEKYDKKHPKHQLKTGYNLSGVGGGYVGDGSVIDVKKMVNEETNQPLSKEDVNVRMIKNAEDQLFFSKKARPVNYEPCTLNQYQREKADTYQEIKGSVHKPNLDREDLVAKRANAQRIKEFSKNLHNINKNIISTEKVRPPPDEEAKQQKQKRELTAREKAKQFAANIPKPKPKPNPANQDMVSNGRMGGSGKNGVRQRSAPELSTSSKLRGMVDDSGYDDGADGGYGGETKLNQLEMKHDNARAEIEQMRREFGM